MAKIFVLLSVMLLSISAWSQQDIRPASTNITYEMARKIAIDHAVDNVFSEILDAESSMTIVNKHFDKSSYSFCVTAIIDPLICTVEVTVNTESGVASNNQEMNCNQ